jgi:cytochrome c biogenesis factor
MPTTAENVIQTTTLMIVAFTVLVLGGGTVPTLKLLRIKVFLGTNKRTILFLPLFCSMILKCTSDLLLLKTKGNVTDNNHEENNIVSESEQIFLSRNFFIRIDKKYDRYLTTLLLPYIASNE